MSRLQPDKLHVTFSPGAEPDGPTFPRRYTLTHSDQTGDLFLTVGPEYDEDQLGEFQVRLMRDEVLGEWLENEVDLALHVHCHISGSILTLGPAWMRLAIFRRELPLVLEALRLGDRRFFEAHPNYDKASIKVHLHARQRRYDRVEDWGMPADYNPHPDVESL